MLKKFSLPILFVGIMVLVASMAVIAANNTNLFNVFGTGANRNTLMFYVEDDGDVVFTQDVAITGTLTTTGAQTQTGAVTFTGLLTANGGLTETGLVTVNGNITSTGTVTGAALSSTGASTLTGLLTVNGNVTSTGTLTGAALSVTGASTLSGATALNGATTMGAAFYPYSRTEAELKVSTPTAVGGIWYDSTNKEFVQSTGTATCFDYAKIEDPTAAPDGW